MNTYHPYHIRFCYDGTTEPQTRTFRAANAAHAQMKCRQEYPGCQLLEVWREEGSPRTGYAITVYEVVSTARIEPLPAPEVEEQTFSFFDQCKGERRPFSG
jgi:hypothetical protein